MDDIVGQVLKLNFLCLFHVGSKKASIGSLDSNLSDSINTTPVGRLSKGRSVSESDSNSQPSTPVRVISSPFVDVSDASADVSGDPTESIYYKLRKFISLNEQTQEMSIDVEAKLKEFESENKEFIKVLLEAKKDSGSSTSRKSSLT